MKILHIGREENMERYPAPDYIAEEIETVSLPMEKDRKIIWMQWKRLR